MKPGVVVDVCALQTASSADRGIGRYTLELFGEIERRHPDAVAVYSFDRSLPIHANLHALEPSGKLRPADHVDVTGVDHPVLHLASIWEPLPLDDLIPPWVRPGHTRVVGTVYDVIPLLFPDIYLRDEGLAAWYRTRSTSLVTMDHLVAISEATAHDVEQVTGVPASRVTPIHGGVSAMFEPPQDEAAVTRHLVEAFPAFGGRSFVLGPLGIEPRKNLDRLLQAYSTLSKDLRARHPLVIQCAASDADVAALRDRGADLGCGDDLHFTRYVSDQDLVALYQGAHLVVFPSIYEGLGLPVLEARACGTPVICGDNSALREVMPDARARFDAGEVADIARSLRSVLTDHDLRTDLVRAPLPAQYEWSRVADALVEVYDRLRAHPPLRSRPPRRPHLAVSSPAPPDRSGPAVYLGRLLEHLPDHCDVTLLTPDDVSTIELDGRVNVEPLGSLGARERLEGRFDEVLYFFGNSERHVSQSILHRQRPGSVLLHDARLVGMYRQMEALAPQHLPDPAGFVPSLLKMYPDRYLGSLSKVGHLTQDDVERLGVLMVADVATTANRLFVHSEHAADLVDWDCGRRPEVVYPLPCPDPAMSDVRRSNVDEGLVVSFGILSPLKASGVIVEALAHLDPTVRVALVGAVDDRYRVELLEKAAVLGVEDRLTLTGSVSDEEYREWLGRAGIALQLRTGSNGESSAALNDTLAAGIPTIVSQAGTFRGLPDDLVLKVPSRSGPVEVAGAVRHLLSSPGERAQLAARGLGLAGANTYALAAERLVDALFG